MKVVKVFAAVFLSLFCVFTLIIVLPSLPSKQVKEQKRQQVLTLWHVETFVGGSSSRADWLEKTCARYSKKSGALVSVVSLTKEQAERKIADGDTFDFVSFSCGAGEKLLPLLQPFSGVVRAEENLARGGLVDGVCYAVPYMTGGYGLFAKTSVLEKLCCALPSGAFSCGYQKKVGKKVVDVLPLCVSQEEFSCPTVALSLSVEVKDCAFESSFQAYADFCQDKYACLLGTQRDVFRLANRLNASKIEDLTFCPLGGFTDLAQYFAVSRTTQNADLCRDVVEYFQSSAVQLSLSEVGMLSATGEKVYADGWLADLQNALYGAKTLSVFADADFYSSLGATGLVKSNPFA